MMLKLKKLIRKPYETYLKFNALWHVAKSVEYVYDYSHEYMDIEIEDANLNLQNNNITIVDNNNYRTKRIQMNPWSIMTFYLVVLFLLFITAIFLFGIIMIIKSF